MDDRDGNARHAIVPWFYLRTAPDLSVHFRDDVLRSALVEFAA
jgi:hypothetical protein